MMEKIVEVLMGPSITDTGAVGRVVQLADGSGQVQSYGPHSGWEKGGTDVLSLYTAEDATKEKLAERGLTEQQIDEVLAGPDDS